MSQFVKSGGVGSGKLKAMIEEFIDGALEKGITQLQVRARSEEEALYIRYVCANSLNEKGWSVASKSYDEPYLHLEIEAKTIVVTDG